MKIGTMTIDEIVKKYGDGYCDDELRAALTTFAAEQRAEGAREIITKIKKERQRLNRNRTIIDKVAAVDDIIDALLTNTH